MEKNPAVCHSLCVFNAVKCRYSFFFCIIFFLLCENFTFLRILLSIFLSCFIFFEKNAQYMNTVLSLLEYRTDIHSNRISSWFTVGELMELLHLWISYGMAFITILSESLYCWCLVCLLLWMSWTRMNRMWWYHVIHFISVLSSKGLRFNINNIGWLHNVHTVLHNLYFMVYLQCFQGNWGHTPNFMINNLFTLLSIYISINTSTYQQNLISVS